jgi:arginyl-tRNA synthetase
VRKGAEMGVDAPLLASQGRTFMRKSPLEKEEIALAVELLQLPDVIEIVLGDLFPHRICEYLYDLCTVGTTFVTQCFVLNKDDKEIMESRLILCSATCAVMKKCFDLLGINPLERI